MLDTIRRLFAGSRPVDILMLVIEFLVLGLIAYEVLGKVRKDQRIKKRLIAMRGAMANGHSLQEAIPRGTGITDAAREWGKSVDLWVEETGRLLETYSPQAVVAFVHDPGELSKSVLAGGGPIADPRRYTLLVRRLNNLKDIMEKPDVYF